MDPFVLDLSLEVVEGAVHDWGHQTCYCRLRANTRHPLEPPPELIVLERGPAWEWQASEPKPRADALDALGGELRRIGFPGRPPRVEAAPGNPTGWQEVSFLVALDGKEDHFHLILQYGGLAGPNSAALRTVWQLLARLAGLQNAARWIDGTAGSCFPLTPPESAAKMDRDLG